MRVALNGRFLTQRVTGVQRHALELVRALDSHLADDPAAGRGLELSLLVPRDGTFELDLRCIRIRRVGKLRGHSWEQFELPVYARGELLVSFANAAPAFARRQIVTIHDASVFVVPEAYSRAFRSWYRLLLPFLGRKAALVLTDSEFSRSELARNAGIAPERIRVVPGGHEHILATPADCRVLARHGLIGRPFVLAVSSLSRHKNLQAIAEAIEILGERDCAYVIAGGTNSRIFDGRLRSWPACVVPLGYVTDAELRALYQHAACLAYPSFYEGFGFPPLEAMACACPVVVSRAASLPEVCGDAAVYVNPADPRDLAAAIDRVLGDAALRVELGRRGQERARRFSWKRTAREVLGIVREIGLT